MTLQSSPPPSYRAPFPCGEHSGQCARVRALEARVLELEESQSDLHDRVLVGETRAAKGADTFGRYIWPVFLVLGTAAATRFIARSPESNQWPKDYSLSPVQSSSAH